jgi:hypothetical protein
MEQPKIRLRAWQHAVIFLVAFAVIVSRRPDAVFHPQFYSEDGYVWFADAYNLGWWPALFRTWAGYFQTLPRLVASLALLVPFSRVPLLLNIAAIFFQILPANLLLSSRSSVWGSLRFRIILASMYLVLPNCDEVYRGITNAQWSLVLCVFMLLVARAPRSTGERFFDVLILLLSGLTGPFCIFLSPIAIFLAWKHRDSWRWVGAGILTGCCLIQLCALVFLARSARLHEALGASPGLFGRLLGSQVYLEALLGGNKLSAVPGLWITIFLCCVAIGGTAFVAICIRKSPMAIKLFFVFSGAVFASGLINPFLWDPPPNVPVWVLYASSPGLRYWFFPTLTFAWSLLWGYRSRIAPVKITSAILLCLMCLGILRDWRHNPFLETNLADSIACFEAAPAGTIVTIPEFPRDWDMKLVKH